uniref:Uncharacterized protein n=1 Tax=Triticum urartu TaxID=4572 RepID=A0A8R7Q949_TRIUA
MQCRRLSASTGDKPWARPHTSSAAPSSERRTWSAGKLRTAAPPRMANAAWSYASAAASGLSKVPSHTRTPFRVESRISAANLPHGRFRTPRNARPTPSATLPSSSASCFASAVVGAAAACWTSWCWESMSSRSISSASLVSNGSTGGGVAGARWCQGAESAEPVEEPGECSGN